MKGLEILQNHYILQSFLGFPVKRHACYTLKLLAARNLESKIFFCIFSSTHFQPILMRGKIMNFRGPQNPIGTCTGNKNPYATNQLLSDLQLGEIKFLGTSIPNFLQRQTFVLLSPFVWSFDLKIVSWDWQVAFENNSKSGLRSQHLIVFKQASPYTQWLSKFKFI